MASVTRALFRPAASARHALSRSPRVPGSSPFRAITPLCMRGMATVGDAPPMEPEQQKMGEMAVGELEGASFKIEPLRRVGEDETTMRARLVYQSRKRGTLESDLLLSTFADANLPAMTREQMVQYDLFLDENDWDIYYWATQDEPAPNSSLNPSNPNPPDSGSSATDTSAADYGSASETENATAAASAASTASRVPPPSPYKGEWAQTVGTFKPAYRPVPARWRDSEVLALLRDHVKRRAGEKGGMAFMPALR